MGHFFPGEEKEETQQSYVERKHEFPGIVMLIQSSSSSSF